MNSPRQKKKLNETNPRHSPKKNKRAPRTDGLTIVLSITAAVLLILVILFLNPAVIKTIFPKTAAVSSTNLHPTEIERVENNETVSNTEEPIVNLGVPEQTQENTKETAPAENTPDTEEPDNTAARLFFIRVSDEGKISMKSVLRPVPSSGSPLKTSITALLEGPRPNELSNDVLSLIPEGSQLLGARIENGVAFLDFNEQFRFNALGIEGYKSQVEQIVYTATEFPTVKKVQILIEGQRIEYLGGEGFWVGGPLGREDF